MNKLAITAAAVIFSTSAFAVDLPSKTTPVAPSAPVKAASIDNNISVEIGYESPKDKYWYGDRNRNTYDITYTRNLWGGLSAGAKLGTSQVYDQGSIGQAIEGQFGYKLPTMLNTTFSGKAAIGQEFTPGKNFTYYALYGNTDYKLSDSFSINAVQYRYRNSVDTVTGFESHQLGTGATYTFGSVHSVFGKVYRNFDKDYNSVDNGVNVGYNRAF
jgi:hypothetical protein